MKENTSPLMVTIRCLAYNHEPYIRQCLEGFVMQKTNFRFEAIVHDDASTDGTAAIIREYAEKYPDIIKPIFETENQYSKRDGSLRRIMDAHTHGKYVATCEGDDYWIDPLKLQKQVDFLEKHPECVYSCHRYYIYNELTKEKYLASNKYFDNSPSDTEFIFDLAYPFSCDWVTKTLTCLFKREVYENCVIGNFKYRRDVHLVYYILSAGKGVCHSFVGGVYRKNLGGIYGSLSDINQLKMNYKVFAEFYSMAKDPFLKKLVVSNYAQILVKERKIRIPHNLLECELLFIHMPPVVIRKIFRKLCFFVNKK